ncbi:uracil-DNA glycosylase [Kordiimonas pumila]|uniref:Type-5 uracil-DNA glycosylase n=1 Tax=Kordiimonas pumila TaxID=2161677 RepID=A0ABV7D1G6_9PROT|nr:uracil-DNA glycosylase [Kordiimonas pumila]
MINETEPKKHCTLCPRLAAYRRENIENYPTFHNGAVSNFGPITSEILIVGMAPGLKGANQTGRPFTGDFAGNLLYSSLLQAGFAEGTFGNHAHDGLRLKNTLITNAVRCVPPQNKPINTEINNCAPYLAALIKSMPNLKVILSLGHLAHTATVKAQGEKQAHYKFVHGKCQPLPNGIQLISSYHCSRYNVNTGVLTEPMFLGVLEQIKKHIP